MHLLYLIDSVDAPGGAEQALANLAPVYVARGIRLDVAYLVERPGLQNDLRDCGAEVFSLAGHGGRLGWIARTHQLIRRRRPDLIHTTLFESDIAGRIAAGFARVPAVSSLVNVQYGPEHFGDPSLSSLRVRCAQAVDAITARSVPRFHAITLHVASVMSRRLGIPRDKIDVVPRGRDAQRLGRRTDLRRMIVRNALGLGAYQPTVLAAARHEYQKGLDVLLRAVPFVVRQHPDAVFLIAGRKGKMTPTLERLVRESGLNENVRFLGPRDDVPDLLAATDLFVMPSRWEGMGSALLEAMALEAPIVASDLVPIREVVVNEETALLAPSGDPRILGAALLRSLSEPGKSKDRSVRARAAFESRFTIDRVCDEMLAFYGRALGGADSLATTR